MLGLAPPRHNGEASRHEEEEHPTVAHEGETCSANGEAVGRVATHGAPSGHPSGDDVGVAVTSQRNLQRTRPDPRRVKVLANQLAAPRGARDERELARMFTTSAACATRPRPCGLGITATDETSPVRDSNPARQHRARSTAEGRSKSPPPLAIQRYNPAGHLPLLLLHASRFPRSISSAEGPLDAPGRALGRLAGSPRRLHVDTGKASALQLVTSRHCSPKGIGGSVKTAS
ncbi:unnamed protein product [Lampetra fluviatilis]